VSGARFAATALLFAASAAPRVTLDGASTPRVTVTPRVAGTAHVMLAVEDNGEPTLTSYRRVI
jgi:hypothetical protein